MRCYQRALVDLCIDGKLEAEKLATYVTRSHDDFICVSDQIQRENEHTIVDDWEADNTPAVVTVNGDCTVSGAEEVKHQAAITQPGN